MPVHTWVQFSASTYQAGRPSRGLFSAARITSVYTKDDCPNPFAAQFESKGLSTCRLQSIVLLQHSAHLGASVCLELNLNKFVFFVESRMNLSLLFLGLRWKSMMNCWAAFTNEGWPHFPIFCCAWCLLWHVSQHLFVCKSSFGWKTNVNVVNNLMVDPWKQCDQYQMAVSTSETAAVVEPFFFCLIDYRSD